ncbi:tail fiber domain-containing protein [Shigella sonnei]
MADQIFTGSGFKLFYNDDTANRIPDNAGNELVNELAAMPSFGIDSQVQTIEVYNSEFSEKLLAEQNVNDIDIVVNYVPDCTAHAFLDQATEDQTEFQLTLQYAVTDGIISYSMVNGMISSARLAGDKDSVVTKSYTFTPTDVLVRDGQAPLSTGLVVGSYGVGSNGVDVPNYEPQLPNGNSFIKVPAARNDNPASADLIGIGLIDSGTFSSIAMTKSGTLAIYAKNQNTAWTRILTATQISDQYVGLTGNQTVAGNKSFTGSTKVNTLEASNGITGTDVTLTGKLSGTSLEVKSAILGAASADTLTLSQPLAVTNGGTGAKTAADSRKNLGATYTNLTSLGSDDLNTLGGTKAGFYMQASSANALATRNYPVQTAGCLQVYQTGANGVEGCVQVYMVHNGSRSWSRAYNNGTWTSWVENYTTSSVVGVANGGTGANSVTGAKQNLGITRFVQSNATRTVVQSMDTTATGCYLQLDSTGRWGYYNPSTANWAPLGVEQGGTGARIPADARTNLGLGTTDRPIFAGVTAIGTGITARGTDTQGSSLVTQMYNTSGAMLAQGELRADNNGNLSLINRGMTSSDATQFYAFTREGLFRPAQGYETALSGDWDTTNTQGNKSVFMSGLVNSPENNVMYGGLHVGYSSNYAFQIAGRAGTTYTRAIEAGTPGGWQEVIVASNKYGLGYAGQILPTNNKTAFLSDSTGSPDYAPSNGGGFQTSYATNRICQFWISQGGGNAYFRANSSNNNPRELKTNIPWITLQNAGTSDINTKNVVGDLDTQIALDNINKLEFKEFRYKTDDVNSKPRRGVIAQQAETVDPEYVHSAEKSGVMTLDSNPLLLDGLGAIKHLSKENDSLKAQITDQQLQLDELRAVVTQLLIAQNK